MLVVIPRGLPRTGLAIARLVILAKLVAPAEPPPVQDFDFGYVGYQGELEPWPGPHTPYEFVVRRGGRDLHVVYVGADPKMRAGDEIGIEGHMVGGQFMATKIHDLCDFRNRECLMRHPEQLNGRPLPAAEPPYFE